MKFINTLATIAMSFAMVTAQTSNQVLTEEGTDLKESDVNIQNWMTPSLLAAIIVTLFLVFMTLFGMSFMAAIQVPSY